MSTPVINAISNVNNSSLNTLFQAVANNATATDSLLGSNRNIDAVGSNAQAAQGLGNNGGDDDVVRRALCRRTGRVPANFPNTATDIVQDGTFRSEILGNVSLAGLLSASQPGMAEIASSATFSNNMLTDSTLIPLVSRSNTAMQEVAASQTAMQEVVASQTARQEVVASQAAMQEVAASQTAIQEVVASQATMQLVAASQTAMQEVAASQPAMQEIAASQTAIDLIASNDNESLAENTVLNSGTATTEFINSPLVADLSISFNDGRNAAQTITNSRVLVVSNDNGVNGNPQININYDNDVGPETQSGSTFIINRASIGNDDGNFGSGNADLSGIIIN